MALTGYPRVVAFYGPVTAGGVAVAVAPSHRSATKLPHKRSTTRKTAIPTPNAALSDRRRP
jgi:hypothetical protein